MPTLWSQDLPFNQMIAVRLELPGDSSNSQAEFVLGNI